MKLIPPSYSPVTRQILIACAIAIVVVVVALIFAGCSVQSESVAPTKHSIKPGTDIQLPPMEWRIRTPEDLARIYAESGAKTSRNEAIDAFIGRDPGTGQIIIYTAPPKFVDGAETRALGHEVMHEALGDYHK